MGLILNKSLPMFKVGYPTVSDKYNVSGAVLTGDTPVKFGDPVKLSGTPGYFEKGIAIGAIENLAGFVVATNVKLAEFGTDIVLTQPGEAFNLLINGFIAVELDSGATLSNIKANAKVAINLATGALTTSGTASTVDIPNTVFTGLYENHGTAGSPKYVAEIYVK